MSKKKTTKQVKQWQASKYMNEDYIGGFE